MYEVKKEQHPGGGLAAEVIPISHISRSCHLMPHFKNDLATALDPGEVLNTYETFFVNEFLDLHTYLTL
jgi:hypothetical protein